MILNSFQVDIHIYIIYYTLNNGDKHWNYIKLLPKVKPKLAYINLYIICSGCKNKNIYQWCALRHYAVFGVGTVHCPVWIGVDVVWRYLHNIMKNTTVFEGYKLKKTESDNWIYTAINIGYIG